MNLANIIKSVIDKYIEYTTQFKKTDYFYKEYRVLYDKEVNQYCIRPSLNIVEYLTKSELDEIKKKSKGG